MSKIADKSKTASKKSDSIDTFSKKVIGFIEMNPGCRCEHVAAFLAATSKEVGIVLKGFRNSGHLKVVGVARGMQYTRTKKAL